MVPKPGTLTLTSGLPRVQVVVVNEEPERFYLTDQYNNPANVLAHYHENVNRDKMAEMVHLSPGYFSNLFRSEVGMSFSEQGPS